MDEVTCVEECPVTAFPVENGNCQLCNETCLMFLQSLYEANVTENQAPGILVVTLIVSDRRTILRPLRFTIISGNSQGYFSINDTTGEVLTARELDREQASTFTLLVQVTDIGVNPTSAEAAVTSVAITVEDTNTSPPVFISLPYITSISENSPPGTSVFTVSSTDADVGTNALVAYTIKSGNEDSHFAIHQLSGQISTTNFPIDFEMDTNFSLVVCATDGGMNPLTSMAVVFVEVVDRNDNRPLFVQAVYQANIVETSAEGTSVAQLLATDEDTAEENILIQYELVDGFNTFVIDNFTGLIRTSSLLDYETIQEYNLTITANDGVTNTEPLGTATVMVTIVDENDNRPQFNASSITANVQESILVGGVVLNISATDNDSGNNSALYYIIANSTALPFTISMEGVLTTEEQLDRESIQEYNFMVLAIDGGEPPMTGSTSVTIIVSDVNDNEPAFMNDRITVSYAESLSVGSMVAVPVATDRDDGVNSRIAYSITSGNEEMRFSINAQTGEISLQRSLDFETTEGYGLQVTARDGGTPSLSATANVIINITDVNDNSPVFNQSQFTVEFSEVTEIGSVIFTATAFDADSGINANISYSLVMGNTGNTFDIHSSTGVVMLNRPLNFESIQRYNLTISATNPASVNPLQGTTELIILVTDVNEFLPRFLQAVYEATILENQPASSNVIQVMATDPDNDNTLEYQIVDGNSDSSFEIIPSSGLVVTTRPLDREVANMYRLTVQVSDGGSPISFSASATLTVLVMDENDNAPLFTSPSYSASVQENSPIGTSVSVFPTLTATDGDMEGVNTQIVYSIIGESPFSIAPQTGEITVSDDIDYENGSHHDVTVMATDGGNLSSTALISITVININDNAPAIINASEAVTFVEGTLDGVLVTPDAVVIDSDNLPLSLMTMSLVDINGNLVTSPDVLAIAVIPTVRLMSSDSGKTLRVSGNFTAADASVMLNTLTFVNTENEPNPSPRFVRITVSDGTFVSTAVQVTISIELINDNTPILEINVGSQIYSTIFTEGSSPLRITGDVTIEDMDNNPIVSATLTLINSLDGSSEGFTLLTDFPSDMLSVINNSTLLTLEGTESAAIYERALQNIAYINSAEEPDASLTRTINFTITDGQFASETATTVVQIFLTNDPPHLDLGGNIDYETTFLEGSDDVRLSSSSLILLDNDNATLQSATILLVNPIDGNNEILTVNSSDVNATTVTQLTHQIIITGVADVDSYSRLLSSIGYVNTLTNPTGGRRMVEFVVSDGLLNSTTATAFVGFTLINNPPIVDLNGPEAGGNFTTTFLEGSDAINITNLEVIIRDVDSTAVSSGMVRLTNPVDGNLEGLSLRNQETALILMFSEDNSTLLVTGAADASIYSSIFQQLQYYNAAEEPTTGERLITFIVSDGELNSSTVYTTIVVNQVNDRPRLVISSELVFMTEFIEEGSAVRLVDLFAVSITDEDNTTMDRLTLTISGLLDGANEEIEYIDPSSDESLIVQETRLQMGSKQFVFRFSNNPQITANFEVLLQTLQYTNTLLEPMAGPRLLEFTVNDGIDNSNTATSNLSIVLINDNVPEFDRFLYVAQVMENVVGIIVTTITATDADSSTGLFASQGIIEYTISSGNDAGLFSINRLTGDIIAEVASDRESESGTFGAALFVEARNPNSTDMAFTNVLITIRDVNDNVPQFLNSSYIFEISELAESGAIVGRVSAEDSDAGSNAQIRYALSQTTSLPFFTIDQTTGQISVTTTAQLDYELQSQHIVTVTASDRGRPTLTNSTLITIALIDENDNSPLFEQAAYTSTVSESTQPGNEALTVRANDVDFEGNDTIFYSIAANNNNNTFVPFTINRVNGIVTVNGPLDREMVDSYSFLVIATDTAGHSDTANITIAVEDSNDNAPIFLQTEYRFSIREDAMVEFIIGTVSATDNDIGSNADILYSITEPVPFHVIPTSGVITVIGQLDRETVDIYQFAVMANNTIGPADFDTANVTITITDVNDNDPVFSEQVYEVNIQENFPLFIPFVVVMANDSDIGTNAIITYQLLPSPNSELFGINETTGGVYAIASIDYETLTVYRITVTASDGMRSSQAVINISVSDENDNAPVFDAPSYSGSVAENTLSSNVIVVQATDSDSGSNSEIDYSIFSNEVDLPFSINTTSGVVFLTRTLDREERDEYNFFVRANDRGFPSLSAVSSVTITVQDQNDNAPTFNQATYNISLLEGAEAVGTVIFNVTAVDEDLGSNSVVMYSITEGNERRQFSIDIFSGEVTLIAPLDAETVLLFELTIEARDTGFPAQSNRTLALIDVLNVNDNVPTINTGMTMVIFQEGNNSVFVAPSILVQDADVDHLLLQANATLLCPCGNEEGIGSDIQGVTIVDNTHITISGPITDANLTAILQSIRYINTDPEPVTEDRAIVFTVYDGMAIATANVTVRITTINDHPPVIDLNITNPTSFNSQTMFTEGSQPILVFGSAIAISDADSDGDLLEYINVTLNELLDATEQITATPNRLVRVFTISATMLQLLGPAAHADFIDVLTSVSYQNTANNPRPPLQREVEVVVYDGVFSATASGVIIIETINDAPEIQLSNQLNYSTVFIEEGNPVSLVTAAFTLQDPDSITLQSALIEILNPEQGDYLIVNPQNNISIETNRVSFRITGPASLEVYAAVLRSARYFNNMSNPTAGVRTVAFTVNDGGSSATAYAEVTIALMNNPPTIGITMGNNVTEFVEGGPPVRFIPTGISITDEDSTDIHSAVITLTNIVDRDQERIELPQQTNLTFTYNNFTGKLVIQGQSMPSIYEEVLASITYSNIAEEPSNIDRQIGVTVSDGATVSNVITFFIRISLINDAPQVILNGEDFTVFSVLYFENSDPMPVVNDLSAQITDVDSQLLSYLTLQLDGILDGELEGLSFENSTALRIDTSSDIQSRTYNITYGDQQGFLGMYTELLRSIRYNNLALEPNATTNRTILFTVSDGQLTSSAAVTTITIQLIDDNQPVFVVKEYIVSIEENSTSGTLVVQLTASDADLGDRFIYVLQPMDDFVLSPETGVVTTVRNIDREDTEFYMLTAFLARSSSPNSLFDDEAVINITVLDINDNSPMFSQDLYTIEIPENTTTNTIIFTTNATDADVGSNAIVRYSIITNTNIFSINSTTGDVILTQSLDYENIRIHNIIIAGEDQGQPVQSGQTMLRINVTDINDSPPVFLQMSYIFPALETLPVGSMVGQVMADDRDSGVNSLLTYSIVTGNVDLTFAINESSGIIEIANPLNFSAVQQYNLMIMVTDQGMPPLDATTLVSVRVVSADSMLPMFLPPSYQAEVFENATIDTLVVQVMAVDPLTNQSDNLMYSLPDQTLTVFVIDSTTGIISVNGTLDREGQDTYQFEAIAEDSNDSTRIMYAQIRIVILDANDFAPVFTQPLYNFFLEEESSPGVVVGTVSAIDEQDVGLNSAIMDYIIEDQDVPFSVNASGTIISQSIIDRENVSSFVFNVTASDAGVPMLSGNAVVRITITDINDNPPVFDEDFTMVEVMENASIGHLIITVSAFDVDISNNGTVQYNLLTDETVFAINQLTGVLILQELLDYETISQYNVTVMATDLGSPQMNSTLLVTINVIDVDDTGPVFLLSEYVFNVSENASVPSEVGTVTAIDVDSSVVIYSLPGSDALSEFSINAMGVILLVQSLDHERTTEYPLIVTASSSDYNGNLLTSTATVLILVTDVNDNSPVFLNQPYVFTVLENATIGTRIGRLTITDQDNGMNSLITATIESDAFSASNFTVVTTTSLDRESQSVYSLQLVAEDFGTPSLSSSTNITIIITDVNDNAPMFLQDDSITITIPENSTNGTIIFTASASDADEGPNAVVTYSFDNVGTSTFNINSITGVVTLSGQLDAEMIPTYSVVIVASDGTFSSNMTLQIQIVDTEDSPVRFTDPTFVTGINENSPNGSPVEQVVAEDPDGMQDTSNIRYGLVDESMLPFRIDSMSGLITVSGLLDREDRVDYTLTVTASNVPFFTATATVVVNILDIDDTAPEFSRNAYQFTVTEGINAPSVIGSVTAMDPDILGLVFNYLLLPSNSPFIIDFFGSIMLTSPLDFETQNQYSLTAFAIDLVGLNGSVPVVINVTDVNDNRPVFLNSSYLAILEEDAPVDTIVIMVSATDDDTGSNSEIQYHLSPTIHPFSINSSNGVVLVSEEFANSSQPLYELTVIATDSGAVPLSSTVTLLIRVLISGRPPVFVSDIYEASISEAVDVGSTVLQVLAINQNTNANNDILYFLDPNDTFSVDPFTGNITTLQTLDRENVSFYALTALAVDNSGDMPLQTSVEVRINVTDDNDNSPQFSMDAYNASLLENTTVGTAVLSVSASDSDISSNGAVTYTIIPSNSSSYFGIDVSTGVIIVQQEVDFETFSTIYLTVRAQDGGLVGMSATATVTIDVIDVDDNPPIFTPSQCTVEYIESIPIGSIIIQLMATDADQSNNSAISYQLINDTTLFMIDADNGTIILQPPGLDFETDTRHILTAEAFNPFSESFSATATVTIIVMDENDNAPIFQQTSYQFNVTEDTPLQEIIGVITATDDDLPTNGVITYTTTSVVVDIGEFTGELRLAENLDRETIDSLSFEVIASDQGSPQMTGRANVTITVVDINDNVPEVIIVNSQFVYTEGSDNINIGTGITIRDNDTFLLQTCTILLQGGNGFISIPNRPTSLNITSSDNMINLTGPASPIAYTMVLRSLQFSAADRPEPEGGQRTISITVYDDQFTSTPENITISIELINDNPPILDLSTSRNGLDFSTAFVEEGSPVNIVGSDATLSDMDVGGVIEYISIVLHGALDGPMETLQYTAVDGVFIEMPTNHSITINGPGNTEDFLITLQSLAYLNTVDEPSQGIRNVTFTVSDGMFNNTEEIPITTITIVRRNDPPEVHLSEVSQDVFIVYSEANDSVPITQSGFTITDDDGTILTSLMVTIQNYDQSIDRILYTNSTGLSFTTEIVSGELQVHVVGMASLEVYTEVLGSLMYAISTDVNQTFEDIQMPRMISVTVNDGMVNSEPAQATVVFSAINNPPLIMNNSPVATFTEQSEPVLISPLITIIDIDSVNLTSITASIETIFDSEMEVLQIQLYSSLVSIMYNSTSGILSLYGEAAVEEYQKLVRNLSYVNTDPEPTEGTRRIVFNISDGEAVSMGTVVVNVEQINDPPELNATDLTSIFVEEGELVALITAVTITDEDNAIFSRVTVIISGAEDGTAEKIVIPPLTGVNSSVTLITATTLQYEIFFEPRNLGTAVNYMDLLEAITYNNTAQEPRASTRNISVSISDGSNTSNTISASISISLINDNPPVFIGASETIQMPENIPIFSTIFSAAASDLDADSEITYSIENSSCDIFSINSLTGHVIITDILNYEVTEQCTTVIVATDGMYNTTFTLIVNITDENDNPPVFVQDIYTTTVMESVPIGTTVLTVSATDDDSGVNSVIIYFIATNLPFNINETSGAIFTTGSLDFETAAFYLFTVEASDRGSPPHNSTVPVNITVTDVNELPPEFDNITSPVFLPEDTPVNETVLVLSASDPDGNSMVEFFIVEDNSSNSFILQTDTGNLTLAKSLDRESNDTFQLEIVVVDTGILPRLTATTQLTIVVEDVNDNDPMFLQANYNVTVPEDTSVGTTIIELTAVDEDIGTNAILYYSIISGNMEGRFEVGSSGEIFVQGGLDWETTQQYQLEITVSNNLGNTAGNTLDDLQNDNAIVTIFISDVNDNSPIFLNTIYEFSINENATINTVIGMVSAVDGDGEGNNEVDYQIQPNNFTIPFSVDVNGGITLVSSLDYETRRLYSFIVTAIDSGNLTGITTVSVEINNVNDNPPEFFEVDEFGLLNITVLENTFVGTNLTTISATDRDNPDAPTQGLTYGILDNQDAFLIDAMSGVISLNDSLDYENTTEYNITVFASDSGEISLTSTVILLLFVEDYNEFIPVFTMDVYSLDIAEDSDVLSSVITVSASDADGGPTSIVEYELIDDNSTFIIDRTTGMIQSMILLDRETIPFYSLTVRAYNPFGDPALESFATLNITITDVNDNAPLFPQEEEYLASIPIGIPAEYSVIQVTAVDIDATSNALIHYSIVSASVPFSISENGSIFTSSLINELRTYSLLVSASDGGDPQMNGSTIVTIRVLQAADFDFEIDRSGFLLSDSFSSIQQFGFFVNTAPGQQGTLSASLLNISASEGYTTVLPGAVRIARAVLLRDMVYVGSRIVTVVAQVTDDIGSIQCMPARLLLRVVPDNLLSEISNEILQVVTII